MLCVEFPIDLEFYAFLNESYIIKVNKKMEIAKRNHYLPRFYLKNFVFDADGIFWVYYKGTEHPKPQTPINTGIEKNLYTVKQPDGTFDDSIEKSVLSPMEAIVNSKIKRLSEYNGRLKEEDISDLSLFLSFMATRVPRNIEAAREMGAAYAQYELMELLKNPDELENVLGQLKRNGEIEENVTVEYMQKTLDRFDERFKISFDKKWATGWSLLSVNKVYEELINMNWCLCRAPSKHYFITSDCPVVCFVLDDKGSAMFGAGYALRNAEVSFPISPAKCLYLDRRHTEKYRAISKNFIKEINKRTAWAAERFLISHIKTNYNANLNKWASLSINRPKLDKKKLFELFKRAKPPEL